MIATENIVEIRVPIMTEAQLLWDAQENERLRQECLTQASGYVIPTVVTPL